MPLSQKGKSVVRIATFATTTTLGMVAAFVGSLVGMNGGDFWPWAVVSFGIYGGELVYVSIIAIKDWRAPAQQQRRDFYRRRRASRAQ